MEQIQESKGFLFVSGPVQQNFPLVKGMLEAKAVRIHTMEGQTYRCMGSYGTGGMRMTLEFSAEGVESGEARLDGFFRNHLGDLTRATRSAIKRTMPEKVTLYTRKHKDIFGKDQTIFVVRKQVLESWLVRVKQELAPK